MPRVAHVISTPEGVGGAERIVASLVRGAFDRGWDPVVLNPFGQDGERADLAALTGPAPLEAYACSSVWGLPRLRAWLKRRLDELQPDVIHVHLFHAAVASASIPLPVGAKSVLTHHHGDHLMHSGRRTFARLDRWAGSRFDRVVAISNANRSFLRESYGYEPNRLALIPNGWEGEPRPLKGGSQPTVICVANFREQKGHQDLVQAFARVRRALPEARLVLVGSGALRGEIESEVDRLQLKDAVVMRQASDVWEELARADVFALASHYEPLGIAVIEAMAAGLPVVASAVGGIPELVKDGETGRLVSPADPDALADRILELLGSEATRRRMGAAGIRAAGEMKSSRMVEAYFALYRSIGAG
jgi:glycosyltransferase involved in cell wall biosynthesis